MVIVDELDFLGASTITRDVKIMKTEGSMEKSKPSPQRPLRVSEYEALARPNTRRPQYDNIEIRALALSLVQLCQFCGTSYVAKKPLRKKRHCSLKCRNKDAARGGSVRVTRALGLDGDSAESRALKLISSCAHCGDPFIQTTPGRVNRFCSRECVDFAQRKNERRSTTCKGCDLQFEAKPDHGEWPKFCSRKCYFAVCNRPVERECLNCATVFTAKAMSKFADQIIYQQCCSTICAGAHRRIGREVGCVNCGIMFYVTPSHGNKRLTGDGCCSRQCNTEFRKRDRAHAWKGGMVAQNHRPYRRIDRTGYAAKYEGEHRLTVERVIGRNMHRGEVVFCIDRNNNNLDPANLFLCSGQKEYGFYREGTLPWPERSNLLSHQEGAYQCPEIAVVLHEWLNGFRDNGAFRGKKIRRHPQAEEIIARRRAGASIRDLAAAFNSSLSNMATTIKTRL